MTLFRNIIFLLSVSYVNAQTSVTASVDINRISQSETIGFKILATNVDATPNVDISPIKKNFKIGKILFLFRKKFENFENTLILKMK